MKQGLFCLLALLMLVGYSQKKTDLQKANLKGKVKSIRHIYYVAVEKLGVVSKGKNSYGSRYEYDQDGNEIEKILGTKHTHKYDDKGNLVEDNRYRSDGSLFVKKTYKYDDNGNQIELNIYDDSSVWKDTYAYDDKGNQIEYSWYYGNNRLHRKGTYKYDAKGNQIEENRYNADGSLDRKTTYKSDDKGNAIEENRYNADGSLAKKATYKYKYDSTGNWIEQISYDSNGKAYEVTKRTIRYY